MKNPFETNHMTNEVLVGEDQIMHDLTSQTKLENTESVFAKQAAPATFGYDRKFVSELMYQARQMKMSEQDLAMAIMPKPSFWSKVSKFLWNCIPFVGVGAVTGTAGYMIGKASHPPVFQIIAEDDQIGVFGE